MKKSKKELLISVAFLAAFVIWTIALKFIDVKMIGPDNSYVGFAFVNGFVHELFGVHMMLYNITDLLGLVPILVVVMFAFVGFYQMIKRKSLLKIDPEIIVLGIYYLIVVCVFLVFEKLVVNFRPVLIEGVLEASYPSSTTMLTMCVMPTLVMMLGKYVSNRKLFIVISSVVYTFTGVMVILRLVSGVHWFSDIVGGVLVSLGLFYMYSYFFKRKG